MWAGSESHIIPPAGYGLPDCRNLRRTQKADYLPIYGVESAHV
jgi:hypothetical protein